MPKRLYLLLCAAALAVTAVAVTPAAGQEPPAEPTTLADDTLRRAVSDLEAGREAGTEVELVDGRARVEILHHSDTATVTALVEAAGGEVYGDVPGQLVEGLVPWEALGGLEAAEEIDFIRTPESISEPIDEVTVADSGAEIGYIAEAVDKTQANTWHHAGERGAGVRIGVVDLFDQSAWNAARSAGEVQAPADTFCRVQGSSDCTVWDADEPHGVAVVETLDDMAPDAAVYLAYVDTTADFQAAIEWFAENEVDIVTRSLTSPYDGPGDGTGPIAEVIDNAVAEGMTVFQAAGNASGRGLPSSPGSYLRWLSVDEDADGWVEFAPGEERLRVTCAYLNGLRWDDFGEGAGSTDYDLYVYNGAGTVLQDTSEDQQQLGALPIERTGPCTSNRIEIAVRLEADGTEAEGDVLEFMMNGAQFEYWSNPGGAGGPASDTANPGALTVGAVAPVRGLTAAFYSSQGPTNDSRMKPDLVAASCFASFVAQPYCFGGTSASTPVVAGAAALYLGTGPSLTEPTDITQWILSDAVVDRGAEGPDQVHGHGELILDSMGQRPRYKPDATIRPGRTGPIVGNNIYSRGGPNQTVTQRSGPGTVLYTVALWNDGNEPERLGVAGARSAFGFQIRYGGSAAITRRVVAGNFFTPVLDPGEQYRLTVSVTIPRSARPGNGIEAGLTTYSNSNFSTEDTVGFVTIRR